MENLQGVDSDDGISKASLESLKVDGEDEEGIAYDVALEQLLNDEQSEEELPYKDEYVVDQQAQRHYSKHMALCSCAPGAQEHNAM